MVETAGFRSRNDNQMLYCWFNRLVLASGGLHGRASNTQTNVRLCSGHQPSMIHFSRHQSPKELTAFYVLAAQHHLLLKDIISMAVHVVRRGLPLLCSRAAELVARSACAMARA